MFDALAKADAKVPFTLVRMYDVLVWEIRTMLLSR